MATSEPGPPVTPDGRYIVVRGRLWRRSDPRLSAAAREALGLSPAVPWKEGVKLLAEWLRESRGLSREFAPLQQQAVA